MTNQSPDPRRNFPDPAKLLDVREAAKYCGIGVPTLEQWQTAGYAPHYFLGSHGPYFSKAEIKTWVKDNLLSMHGGLPIPSTLPVFLPSHDLESPPPLPISQIPNLCKLHIHDCSGIYFLCDGVEVVYIGQSRLVYGRVVQHIKEKQKSFDLNRVFFLPCPTSDLDGTERHFINLFKPKYNGGESKAA